MLPIDAELKPGSPGDAAGSWDAIHVFEAAERGRQAHYKLTSTVMLALRTGEDTTLSGSLTRQVESDGALAEPGAHVGNMGRAIEEMEIRMRNALQEVCMLVSSCSTFFFVLEGGTGGAS
jgi:capping protein (actin filament) muscle Z-line, beta